MQKSAERQLQQIYILGRNVFAELSCLYLETPGLQVGKKFRWNEVHLAIIRTLGRAFCGISMFDLLAAMSISFYAVAFDKPDTVMAQFAKAMSIIAAYSDDVTLQFWILAE